MDQNQKVNKKIKVENLSIDFWCQSIKQQNNKWIISSGKLAADFLFIFISKIRFSFHFVIFAELILSPLCK